MAEESTNTRTLTSPIILIIVVAVLAAIIVLAALYYAFSMNSTTTNNAKATTTPSVSTTPTGTSTPSVSLSPTTPHASVAATAMISIVNMVFSPANITIKTGETVVWTNNDQIAHQIEFTDGTKSNVLNNGQTYSRTFTKAGTYDYICAIHPSMKGIVTVSN